MTYLRRPTLTPLTPPNNGQPWQGEFPGRGCRWCCKFGKRTCKPNSVVCGHSSRRRVAADTHQRPTRRFRQLLRAAWAHRADAQRRMARCRRFPPYLVLLRVGFTLPPALPPERCALTAPVHPYPSANPASRNRGRPARSRTTGRGSRGGIFSVALAVYAS